MFLDSDNKIAYSTDSDCTLTSFITMTIINCTELLDVFSPADALHIKCPLTPISIYATNQEIYQDRYRFC
jgi:hypothetical protein